MADITYGGLSNLVSFANTDYVPVEKAGILTVKSTIAQWRSEFETHVAIVDPTINDDSSAGFVVGRWWLNSATATTFICADNSVGAAVWPESETNLFKRTAGVISPFVATDTLRINKIVLDDSATRMLSVSDNTRFLLLAGGASLSEGASLSLCGESFASAGYDGSMQLIYGYSAAAVGASSNIFIKHLDSGGYTNVCIMNNNGTVRIYNDLRVGSLGQSYDKIPVGWLTDLEITNMPTVGGVLISGSYSYVAPPITPTTVGTQGQWSYDANYLYKCISTNVWVRHAVATTW